MVGHGPHELDFKYAPERERASGCCTGERAMVNGK